MFTLSNCPIYSHGAFCVRGLRNGPDSVKFHFFVSSTEMTPHPKTVPDRLVQQYIQMMSTQLNQKLSPCVVWKIQLSEFRLILNDIVCHLTGSTPIEHVHHV